MAKSKPQLSPGQFNLTYFIVAIFLVLAIQSWFASRQVERLPYSEFQQLLEAKQIKQATIRDDTIQGRFVAPRNGKELFITNRVDPDFARHLEQYGVEFSGVQDDNWLSNLLSWVLPVLLFFGLWMFVFRRFAEKQGLGGMMNVGKSKAKVYVEKSTGVTFDDVAGVDEAKAELSEIVSFLRDRDRYGRLGAHIPKGILLVGPPGTGKTLLARAVAGEASVPFFSISGSEFVEMFVGVGAARVRDLFEQARKVAPAIIFIDELDSLGKARSAVGYGGGNDEKEQTLNQLLNELDGFDPREGIVLLAATNRPEILDPALLRAGRFDRRIVVDRPDRNGREAILRVHMRKVPLEAGFPVDKVAAITPGFSGADLANLVNEAAIVATRREGKSVTMDDFTQAVERIVAGAERRGRLLNPQERERVAWHEMGHALAAASLPGTDPVHKVSIIPRSIGALGYTMTRPTEDRFLITTDELKDRMVVLLAGRAAERLALGSISTGAADDLAKTTDIARQMVATMGMVEGMGQAVLEQKGTSYLGDSLVAVRQKDYSEQTAREVDMAVRELIDEAYERATMLLQGRRADLDAGVQLLLDRETITPDDFAPLRQVALLEGKQGNGDADRPAS
ncbi:MAG: ATP-dependent zinc metalloprotease FtsH [Burkholderiaceae bacterium]